MTTSARRFGSPAARIGPIMPPSLCPIRPSLFHGQRIAPRPDEETERSVPSAAAGVATCAAAHVTSARRMKLMGCVFGSVVRSSAGELFEQGDHLHVVGVGGVVVLRDFSVELRRLEDERHASRPRVGE